MTDETIDWESHLRLHSAGFAPLYAQLAERLRAAAATLPTGTRMPSEKEVMDYSGVGRATARKAIAELTSEGLLVAHRGKGTFVAPGRVPTNLGRPVGFSEGMERLGRSPSSRVLSDREIGADSDIAAGLRIAIGTPVVQLERLRLMDDMPAMIERTHLIAASVPGLLKCELTASLYGLLSDRYGLAPATGTETILAVTADRDSAAVLGISSGSALLSTVRRTETDGGQPLEYTKRLARGDLCSFVITLNQLSSLADQSTISPVA